MELLPAARLELDVEESCRTGRSTPRARCRTRCASRRACLHSCKGGRTCGDMRQDEVVGTWGQLVAQNGDGIHGYAWWKHPLRNRPARNRAILTGGQARGGPVIWSAPLTDGRELLLSWTVAEGADISSPNDPVPLVTTESAAPCPRDKPRASAAGREQRGHRGCVSPFYRFTGVTTKG